MLAALALWLSWAPGATGQHDCGSCGCQADGFYMLPKNSTMMSSGNPRGLHGECIGHPDIAAPPHDSCVPWPS